MDGRTRGVCQEFVHSGCEGASGETGEKDGRRQSGYAEQFSKGLVDNGVVTFQDLSLFLAVP